MGILYRHGNNTVHIKHNESKIKTSYMEQVGSFKKEPMCFEGMQVL